MNNDFDWNAFRYNKIAVRCRNEDEARDFILKCFDYNLKWCNESSNLNKEIFYAYGCKTTYTYEGNMLCMCHDNYYKQKNYSILEWGYFMDDTYKEFTKQDLKTGMVVELRNGKKAMILLGTKDGDIFGGETYGTLNIFDCNLKNNALSDEISKIYIEQIDIVKIYQPTSNYLRDGIFDESNLDLLWERKDNPKEMTVEEIEKELGYSIKIVK